MDNNSGDFEAELSPQRLTMASQYYPPLLREIHDPPQQLYVLGDARLLALPQMAIVGSRRATSVGLHHAKTFSATLAQASLVITSGLALGVDGAAHQGALIGQGRTVAVLASGLGALYPKCHQALAERILSSGGCLVSEMPPETRPLPALFPRRNRLISGLSLGTLVVEAAARSGSLITARLACEQGREVFALPGSLQNQQSAGCHALIQQGAMLVTHPREILDTLGIAAPNSPISDSLHLKPKQMKLEKHAQKLLESVAFEATSVDFLIAQSPLEASEVVCILTDLELKGLIKRGAHGYIKSSR